MHLRKNTLLGMVSIIWALLFPGILLAILRLKYSDKPGLEFIAYRWVFACFLAGLIFSFFALNMCHSGTTNKKSKSVFLNIAIAFSILSMILSVLLFSFISGEELRHGRSRTVSLKPQILKVGEAIFKYAEQNGGILPSAENWCDIVLMYNSNIDKELFINPYKPKYACGFAFNKNLSELPLSTLDPNTILLMSIPGDWNFSGDETLFYKMPRLSVLFLCLDGFVGEYMLMEPGNIMAVSIGDSTIRKFKWK